MVKEKNNFQVKYKLNKGDFIFIKKIYWDRLQQSFLTLSVQVATEYKRVISVLADCK